jgi:hypothetical protein
MCGFATDRSGKKEAAALVAMLKRHGYARVTQRVFPVPSGCTLITFDVDRGALRPTREAIGH